VHQVRVCVDKARQDGHATCLDHVGVIRSSDSLGRPYRDDAIIMNQHRRLGERCSAITVDEQSTANQGRTHGSS